MIFNSIIQGSLYLIVTTNAVRLLTKNENIIFYSGAIGFMIGFIKNYRNEGENEGEN